MDRPRLKRDGLPYCVYERYGSVLYSIGRKVGNKWVFKLQCLVTDRVAIAELRRDAINRSSETEAPLTEVSFGALADAWLKWQRSLPASTEGKRAESNLDENARAITMLKKGFGHMAVITMEKGDAYEYLDACLIARDKEGKLRPRPAKGNKEISLARVILVWGGAKALAESESARRRRQADYPQGGSVGQ